MLSALHTITAYPPDLSDPVFALYPAMKFGERQSVSHFVDRMAPLAQRLMAQSPEDGDWVMTSPVLRGLPSGANLLCEALHAVLGKTMPAGVAPKLEILAGDGPRAPIDSDIAFKHFNEYSKFDLTTRREILAEPHHAAEFDLGRFRDRCVIFVNDINVTGTQMHWVTNLLRAAPPRKLCWLLILNVDSDVGCRFPQLENDINNAKFRDRETFIAFLRESDYRCTGKLIGRLMSYDAASLECIFQSLDRRRQGDLRQAILDEGLYGGALFNEKLDVVEQAVLSG